MLNRRLVLEEAERSSDGAGGYSSVWKPRGVLWGELKAGSGRERGDLGLMTVSSTPYRITVRAAPPGSPRRPRPEQRFREGERIFEIISVADTDPEGKYITCFATEESVA
jgi:head-tail adaptor